MKDWQYWFILAAVFSAPYSLPAVSVALGIFALVVGTIHAFTE